MRPLVVGDLMTREVVTVRDDEDLDLAAQLMSLGRIRHLPVVDAQGALIGLITAHDIARAQASILDGVSVSEQRAQHRWVRASRVMTRSLHTATPDTPLAEAAQRMSQHKLGCLPVVAGGALVGILTEADFVRYVTEVLGPAGG